MAFQRSESILKPTGSFDRPKTEKKKSAKFNEANVMTTFHPKNKDYGFMNIEEPKTPFVRNPPPVSEDSSKGTKFHEYLNINIADHRSFMKRLNDVPSPQRYGSAFESQKGINMQDLIQKLCISSEFQKVVMGFESSEDEPFGETFEEKIRRLEFERRRKMHYTEFQTVDLARRLIQEEFGDWKPEEEPEEEYAPTPTSECIIDEVCTEMICEEEDLMYGAEEHPSSSISLVSSGELQPGHPCYKKEDEDDDEPIC